MEITNLVNRVRKAREQVGPGGAVMFDAHSCLPPSILQQFAGQLQSDDLLFLEEPWLPGNKYRNDAKNSSICFDSVSHW